MRCVRVLSANQIALSNFEKCFPEAAPFCIAQGELRGNRNVEEISFSNVESAFAGWNKLEARSL
jgi:hypothetical protein